MKRWIHNILDYLVSNDMVIDEDFFDWLEENDHLKEPYTEYIRYKGEYELTRLLLS